ncbi:MAG: iron hydrogenase [Planctomycetes bacterium]|nr:iron hydrogenase [Planctomycetota bacterium]
MPTFENLYRTLLLATAHQKTQEELARLAAQNYDRSQLDCLFYPKRYPVVWRIKDCRCSAEERDACAAACDFGAMTSAGDNVGFGDNCYGCQRCIDHCREGSLVSSKDGIAVLEAIQSKKEIAYALIAPAFLGQFGDEVTPGKLRTAFRRLGFNGMIEVAVFADILTLREALEFDRRIHDATDYQLTSCCCPVWIAMIRKVYAQLMPHVPPAVSPMIACGRTIKHLHPEALTVFVGPCLAKKAEAREPDLRGAVDFVLTFQEIQEIFTAFGIEPAELEESDREFSSRAGRIYARAGGVSQAVETTLEKLNPDRPIKVKSRLADGIPACKELLNALQAGQASANFYEGMGCVGGCVGGPKVIRDRAVAAAWVERYGDAAAFATPMDNPYVVDLLHRLGLDTPEDLLEKSEIFNRRFD